MKTKKTILKGALLLAMLSMLGCGKSETMTLEQIAYDNNKNNPVIYLKESDEYVPYLVLDSDYHGNVLLLRKNVLPEMLPYKEHDDTWSFGDYGSYYEESSIDAYINTDFLNSLSGDTREAVTESTITVTDKESYTEWNYKTHEINRKVFLLSSVELGIEGLDGKTTTKEGEPLSYFKKKEYDEKKAYTADGVTHSYWTRTPQLWESCTVVVVGTQVTGTCTADEKAGVRPAFCIDGQTLLKENYDIIEGEAVFVLAAEE